MAILIGIILLALGLSLAVVWQVQVLQAIQGILPLALLFFGAIIVLVGYSERKAAREFDSAIHDNEEEPGRSRRLRSESSGDN
jgi:hypothetical protein